MDSYVQQGYGTCPRCGLEHNPMVSCASAAVDDHLEGYGDVIDEPRDGPREAPISQEELSHILAALTFFRQARLGDAENRPPAIHAIATNGGTLPSLNDERIKLLIERLDGAEVIPVRPVEERHLGTKCSVCQEPQYATPSGAICPNGHGGAPPL